MILSFAIWIPIFFGLIILFYGSEKPTAGVRWLALVGSVIGFIATLPLIIQFDIANPGMQFVENLVGFRVMTSTTTWVLMAFLFGSLC